MLISGWLASLPILLLVGLMIGARWGAARAGPAGWLGAAGTAGPGLRGGPRPPSGGRGGRAGRRRHGVAGLRGASRRPCGGAGEGVLPSAGRPPDRHGRLPAL